MLCRQGANLSQSRREKFCFLVFFVCLILSVRQFHGNSCQNVVKEGPDVSPQKENGTPTKAKRARKCILLQRRKKQLFPKSRFKTVVQPETLLSMSKGYTLSNALKNTELTMKNFGLGWSREIQEQQLLVKTLVLSISYHQLIILTSLDGFLCLFLKLDILMDHYIHLKLSTCFCVGCYST